MLIISIDYQSSNIKRASPVCRRVFQSDTEVQSRGRLFCRRRGVCFLPQYRQQRLFALIVSIKSFVTTKGHRARSV